jgi:hypothetical protein
MDGSELRQRLERLGRPFTELAPLLGLSIDGLNKQMNGSRPVSRQTEIILAHLEREPAPRRGSPKLAPAQSYQAP